MSDEPASEVAAEAQQTSAVQEAPKRPEWLPASFPDWLIKKRHPLVQLVIMLVLYAFHIFFLSKTTWNFPFQLIPNDRGAFQSIGTFLNQPAPPPSHNPTRRGGRRGARRARRARAGLDSVAGLVVVVAVLAVRKAAGVRPIPPILASDNPPWRVPRSPPFPAPHRAAGGHAGPAPVVGVGAVPRRARDGA